MTNRFKNTLIVIASIITLILIVFGFGFSETIEHIILYIIGGLSFLSFIVAMMDDDSKSFFTLLGIVGAAITFGLLFWSESNGEGRREKEIFKMREKADIAFAKKAKEDSIQHINDSIQHIKDSFQIAEDSKRLYAQEGDTIFGQFYFGMTEQEVLRLKEKINRETSGRITIGGHDFIINNCKYHDNKLYFLQLRSANTWVRYYYHDANDYDDSEGFGDGHTIVERIKESLSNKYGKPNFNDNWHFTHKDIHVGTRVANSTREGFLSTQNWAVFLTIDNPPITRHVEIEEKEELAKEKKKAAEEEYQRKKESFGGGL